MGGSCALEVEAGEGVKRWDEGATGLWVLEREVFPPFSLALSLSLFLNVHGWGVLESWRKSCLCVALALSLSFSFAIHFLLVWPSRSHFGKALAITPFGDVSGV